MNTITFDTNGMLVTTGNVTLVFHTSVASVMHLLSTLGYVCVGGASVLRYVKYGSSVGNGHQLGA